MWGTSVVTSDVTVLERRPLPAEDQKRRTINIIALPTICQLGAEGRFELVSSQELNFERAGGGSPASLSMGDLFAGIRLPHMPSPIERSFFRPGGMKHMVARKEVIQFCQFLLKLTDTRAEEFSEALRLPESSRRGMRDLPRFRRLCRGVAEKHLPDLFHWWTAEHSECAYFLTMDGKLRNLSRNQCKDILSTRVVDPEEMLQEMGIKERIPMPMEFGEHVDFFRAVDSDLWPGASKGTKA